MEIIISLNNSNLYYYLEFLNFVSYLIILNYNCYPIILNFISYHIIFNYISYLIMKYPNFNKIIFYLFQIIAFNLIFRQHFDFNIIY